MKQHTIAQAFTRAGVGVHSGMESTVTVHPAPADAGVFFEYDGQVIHLTPTAVTETTMCTQVTGTSGASVRTVEHLLAALHALGVDNARVEVQGGTEIPILDGSSLPWVEAIQAVGLVEQEAEQNVYAITQPQDIILPTGTAHVAPYDGLKITVQLTNISGEDVTASWEITPETFARDIAPTRTFCRQSDVEKLREAGLIAGGSLDCAVVFDDNGQPLNPEGLRFSDEPIRHKVLDAVGDLFLLGRAVRGHFTIPKPGHGINNQLVRALA